MANAEVQRLGRRAREKLNLETASFIVANDGVSPYATRRKGYIRVQQAKGNGTYLPAKEVRNFGNFVISPGRPVRLGYRDGQVGVVWADFDAEVNRGENPGIHNGADTNAHAFTDLSKSPILLAHPDNPPSTSVVVEPIFREMPDGLDLYMPDSKISFATEIAAITTGYKLLAGLFLLADNTVEKVLGSEIHSSDPFELSHLAEVYAARTPGAWPVKVYELASGMTEITDSNEHLDMRQFLAGPPVLYSAASTSSPPTLAELTAAFGAPATVGVIDIILDVGGLGTDIYRVVSTGSAWAYSGYVVAT